MENHEFSIDRIAKKVAGTLRRELKSVPEAFFVWVGEEEFPGAAAVGGFVEAGEVAFA